jgi:hypothetical protein
MIDGDIGGSLFKVAHRVAPRGHHITQQPVGFRYRTRRAVNEARLDSTPGLNEALTIYWREGTYVKSLHPFCAPVERSFRMPPAAVFLHGSSIFRATELSAQPLGPALSKQNDRGDACNENHDERNDQNYFRCAHCW